MRLPQHQSGQVQSLQGVDPGTYRQAGEDAAAFGAGISSVAESGAQVVGMRDAHAAKLAGHETRQQTAQFMQRMQTEDYISADDPLLEGVEDYNIRPDGTVLTSEVAGQIYENQARAIMEAQAENLRPGKTRDSWMAEQEAGIAEQTASMVIQAHRVAQEERKDEDRRLINEAIDNQDFDGARHAISAGNFSDNEKSERMRAVRASEENADVTNAIIARDIGEIDRQLGIMRQDQEDYRGVFSADTRLKQIQRLESARKAIVAGNAAYSKAGRAVALQQLERARQDYIGGGPTTAGQLFDLTEDLAEQTGLTAAQLRGEEPVDYADLSVSDAKALYDFQLTFEDMELTTEIEYGTREEVEDLIGDLRNKAIEGDADDAARYQRALDYRDNAEARKREFPVDAADKAGLSMPREPLDIGNIAGTLPAELAASRAASERYSVPYKPLSERSLETLQDALNTAGSTQEKLAIIAQVNAHLPDPADRAALWEDQMSDMGYHVSVAGDMVDLGESRSTQRAEHVLKGQQILNNKDYEPHLQQHDFHSRGAKRRTATQEVGVRMKNHFPYDWEQRTQAVMAAAASMVINDGLDIDDALGKAERGVMGGTPVRNTGSFRGTEVRPPHARMKQDEFQRGQQGVSDEYYEGIGYTRPNLREQVHNGDVEWRDEGSSPGRYILVDTRSGEIVENDGEDGPPAIKWYERDDVGPARSASDRWFYDEERALERDLKKAASKERKEGYLQSAEAQREARKAKRDADRQERQRQREHREKEQLRYFRETGKLLLPSQVEPLPPEEL